MKLAIHGRGYSQETMPYIKQVLDFILAKGCSLILSDEFVRLNKDSEIDLNSFGVFTKDSLTPDVDAVISLGGDGTFLETLLYTNSKEIPIMGINTGRLGFLATISKQEIEDALTCLYNRNYQLESRMLIHLDSNVELFDGYNFALNEFAITKKDTSSMINVKCFIDDLLLNSLG